jgi:hypothetical protein
MVGEDTYQAMHCVCACNFKLVVVANSVRHTRRQLYLYLCVYSKLHER